MEIAMWLVSLFAPLSVVTVHALQSNVSIYRVLEDGTQEFIGSGVQVDPQDSGYEYLVITAQHVAQDEASLAVCGNDGCTPVLSVMMGPTASIDFAALVVASPVGREAKVHEPGLYLTEQVVVAGFPQKELEAFRGRVALEHDTYIGDIHLDQWGVTGGWCAPGISGAGVYDKHGHLVALVHSILTQPLSTGETVDNTNMCMVIPL